MSLERLLMEATTGSRSAFDAFYQQTNTMLFGYLRMHMKGPDIADVAQNTYMAIWQARYDGRSSAKTFLFTIARNKVADHFRRHYGKPETPLEPTHDVPVADESGNVELKMAMQMLPAEQRELLYMYYTAGFSLRELAEVLEVPEGTVKSRLFAARQALGKIMKDGDVA